MADRAHYVQTLPSLTDFSEATVTVRVAKLQGTGGWFRIYLQHGGGTLPDGGAGDFNYAETPETLISSIGTSFQNITWDVSADTSGFDFAVISRLGIEVSAESGGPWTNPTVLYIDRIDITGASPAVSAWTFDSSSTVDPTPTNFRGAGAFWLNNYSADTTATGCTLSWLGP
jgi:hypothetical protein